MWPGFDSGPARYVDWVCCWFSPCSEGFSLGSPVSPTPPARKSLFSNSISTRIEDADENQPRLMRDTASSLNLLIYYICYVNRISPETEPFRGFQTGNNGFFHACCFFRSSGWEWRPMNGWICPGTHTSQITMESRWRRSGKVISGSHFLTHWAFC